MSRGKENSVCKYNMILRVLGVQYMTGKVMVNETKKKIWTRYEKQPYMLVGGGANFTLPSRFFWLISKRK